MAMETALKRFFSAPKFAVVGASSDKSKFGYKVFAWYLQHRLPATPINPSQSQVTVPSSLAQGDNPSSDSKSFSTFSSPKDLGSAAGRTSLSVITPPRVTQRVLKEAKAAGVRAVWLQPGSFDEKGLEYARREWPDAAIGGKDIPGSRGGDGWCILVDGETGLDLAMSKGKL